jgi:multidrug efflux pump subunit AcrA (membrane-fusion protein)
MKPTRLDRPKLRADLNLGQHRTAAGTSFVIKDPVTRQYYRFGETEHFIVQQLDGAQPIGAIRRKVEDQLGAELPSDTIVDFVKRLDRLGLLERAGGAAAAARPAPARVGGNWLYLRFRAFDPDTLLNWLQPLVRWCFTPAFVGTALASIAFAGGLLVVNRSEIGAAMTSLISLQGLGVAWGIMLGVGMLHEFAHGLTCKQFGGSVREMGFMLLYLNPALYCNVSDAWLFPKKSQRLWVAFAGAFFELTLWAAATILWRLTDPGHWLNTAALFVMATSGIKSLFNFNPLIKLDGYYILSDWLEVPNLRQKSFACVGRSLGRVFGAEDPGPNSDIPVRERRIYLLYGSVAAVFSVVLLVVLASQLGGFLIAQLQGFGFLLFCLLFVPRLKQRLGRLWPQTRTAVAASGPTSAPLEAANAGGPLGWPWRRIVLGALALALLCFGRMELRVAGDVRILPTQKAEVRAELEGIVREVSVAEGMRVERGQVLARLSDGDHRTELLKVRAEIDEKRARLKQLQRGTRPEELDLARQDVSTAQTRLEHARYQLAESQLKHAERLAKARSSLQKHESLLRYAQTNLARSKSLWEARLLSRNDYENAEEQLTVQTTQLQEAQAEVKLIQAGDLGEARKELAVAERGVQSAEAKLALLSAGSRPEELDAASAELARAEAQGRYLEDQLHRVEVTSPIAGIVATPARQLREMIGRELKKGELVCEIHDLQRATAEIEISEKEVADVALQQVVVLKARAYPGVRFEGRVVSIATTVTPKASDRTALAAQVMPETWGERRLLVTTELDNPNLMLKPQMTGKAKIYCGERTILDLMTRRLSRTLRVEFWSWW